MQRASVAFLCCGLVLIVGCYRTLMQATDRDVAAAIEQRQREALSYSRPAPVGGDEIVDQPTPKLAYEYSPRPSTIEVPPDFEGEPGGPGGSAAASQPAGEPAGGTQGSQMTISTPAVNGAGAHDSAASASAPADAASLRALSGDLADPAIDKLVNPKDRGGPMESTAQRRTAIGHAGRPTTSRGAPFTLTDAVRYALVHKRDYQTAKEDLYLAALALTLERHLWTPQYAAEIRTIYGNFGEITDFDQAMRFVSNVAVAQRLPYGGEVTARLISTLIRDVKKSITAAEGSVAELGLNVPFLRDAGHVAQEQLIQLERTLTYAVRDFERFRRRMLVDVANAYFDLLRRKQDVLDSITSLERFRNDFERAQALEAAGTGTILDTRRAENEVLSNEARVEDQREAFRAGADNFKVLIGMPVDEPLGIDDFQDIEAIERQIDSGAFPLLHKPAAADNERRACDVALKYRLDLLNRDDQIDDARRGVAVAKNQLLPDLDWTSTLTFNTNPNQFNVAAFEVARATWRSEVLLTIPIDRYKERNELRAATIDVQRAQRTFEELRDVILAQVRDAVNQLRLQEISLEIQQRNVEVANLRREYARIQFYDGDIGNRDLVEAENDWSLARNRLNFAKTARWQALLAFRLSTETLVVEDDGSQQVPPSELDEQPGKK